MKRLSIIILLFGLIINLKSQEYQANLNYILPLNDFERGINFNITRFNASVLPQCGIYFGMSRWSSKYDNLNGTEKFIFSDLYLGVIKRWLYGKNKIEPFIGVHTSLYNVGKLIIDRNTQYQISKNTDIIPLRFNIRFGFDLNLTKKIALNYIAQPGFTLQDGFEMDLGGLLIGLRYSFN